MTVWKIGSPACEAGIRRTSIVVFFLDYGIVFIDSGKTCAIEVKKDDLLAISDGSTIVAIAKALPDFFPLRDLKVPFRVRDVLSMDYDSILGCKADIVILKNHDRFTFEPSASLLRAPSINDKIVELLERYKVKSYRNSKFAIVRKQAETSEWKLDDCKKRRDYEVDKIMKYLSLDQR